MAGEALSKVRAFLVVLALLFPTLTLGGPQLELANLPSATALERGFLALAVRLALGFFFRLRQFISCLVRETLELTSSLKKMC
jgi:hypothetical protein